ncbi:tail tube protein [Serratia phage vB_SmaA_3M]|uniref:Putative baseplate tail tube protein n=1 Tax=Serratia phage vB_SmaA_3M TaxID=2419930 RepID=A0A3G2YSA1_9CAUD|nr:tail tube protein [Serratia phage vB_SmaA_3M]AYP28406.1 putative baseplate tail tube protein [Serratia phage vB_SmaA_3M]
MQDFHNFITQIVQRGISRKNRFRVTIPLPEGIFNANATAKNDGQAYQSSNWSSIFQTGVKVVNSFFGGTSESSKSLQAMVSVASFPGLNFDTTVLNNNGNHIKMPNNRTQTDIDFTFLLANDYFEKLILDAWKKLIQDPYTSKMGYYDDYTVDIVIEALDSEDNPVHRVYLLECVPINFNSIELDKGATDQYNQYSVSFSYNKLLSETEYQQRSLSEDFLPLGIADAIAAGDWETAASKAGQLYKKIQQGNFTGEALLVYRQLDQLIKSSAGISLSDFERISVGVQRDILGNDNLTAVEKSNLLSLLKGVTK